MKRVVLKLTGEVFFKHDLNKHGFNQALPKALPFQIFNLEALSFLADEISSIQENAELALVLGGGNIARGRALVEHLSMKPRTADYIGMAATLINGLCLQDFLEHRGMETRLMSAIEAKALAEPHIIRRAERHLEKRRIVIFVGGTGNPGFSTDMAAVLRASDLSAEKVLKGTKVRGIFEKDPQEYPEAAFIPRITHRQFLERGFSVIVDRPAVAKAEEISMPIFVFDIFQRGNLQKAFEGVVDESGNSIGSLIY